MPVGTVFVNIFGEQGDSGERQLKNSSTHTYGFCIPCGAGSLMSVASNKFQRKSVDVFNIKCVSLGSLKKLKVRHDNKVRPIETSLWYR
jgi:hypothetical protein